MLFPELPGYQCEEVLVEDPFGWILIAMHGRGERRVMRVYKAQATNDRLLHSFFDNLAPVKRLPAGVDSIYEYRLQDEKLPSVSSMAFHGWRGGSQEPWHTGTLAEVMPMLSPGQTSEIVEKIVRLLAELHQTNLFHGALRPEVFYLVKEEGGGQGLQIGDFGGMFVKGLQYLESGEFLFYAAPEQLESGDFRGGRGRGWDVYSFGVLAYRLLTGRLPRLHALWQRCRENPAWLESSAAVVFGEPSEVAGYFLQQIQAEPRPLWPGPAANAREKVLRQIIDRCLSIVPGDRPTSMSEIVKELGTVGEAVKETLSRTTVPVVSSSFGERTPPPAQGRAVASSAQELVRPLDGGLRESDQKGGLWSNFLLRIRENMVFRLKVALSVSLALTLLASYLAFFHYIKARREKGVVVSDLRESEFKRQEMIQKQAQAFQRIQDEEMRKKQLVTELNESEDSKNQLLGQAKLARQLLRETQDNGDRFFQLVLENRDSDVPEFRKARAATLEEARKHYERLIETYGDASDFIVSTANAQFYLGNIYRETGEFGKALAAFSEAERRYTALLADPKTAKAEFAENIARAKRSLGDLAMRNAQFSAARNYYTESSHAWAEARNRNSELTDKVALRIHENSLSIAESELEMRHAEAALDAAMSVGASLVALQKADPQNHRVIGALAHSFSLTGRILEARGELGLAKDAYQQASDLYAEAVRLDAAVDAYQLGLGNSLARVGMLAKDSAKLEGAAEVLGHVVAANPYESTYLKTLADIYGTLAEEQRDGGNMKNAIAMERRAIGILGPIVDGSRAVADDVKFSYAQRLSHLAELLGDSGKFDESRVPLKEALALLDEISKRDDAPAPYRRSLARARGLAGFACLQSGNKTEAKQHLEIAKVEWQQCMTADPNDNTASQAMKWVSEQLAKLP